MIAIEVANQRRTSLTPKAQPVSTRLVRPLLDAGRCMKNNRLALEWLKKVFRPTRARCLQNLRSHSTVRFRQSPGIHSQHLRTASARMHFKEQHVEVVVVGAGIVAQYRCSAGIICLIATLNRAGWPGGGQNLSRAGAADGSADPRRGIAASTNCLMWRAQLIMVLAFGCRWRMGAEQL